MVFGVTHRAVDGGCPPSGRDGCDALQRLIAASDYDSPTGRNAVTGWQHASLSPVRSLFAAQCPFGFAFLEHYLLQLQRPTLTVDRTSRQGPPWTGLCSGLRPCTTTGASPVTLRASVASGHSSCATGTVCSRTCARMVCGLVHASTTSASRLAAYQAQSRAQAAWSHPGSSRGTYSMVFHDSPFHDFSSLNRHRLLTLQTRLLRKDG
jgi:hypothetical protein